LEHACAPDDQLSEDARSLKRVICPLANAKKLRNSFKEKIKLKIVCLSNSIVVKKEVILAALRYAAIIQN